MKRTWVRNIVVAILALAMVLGIASVALAAAAITISNQGDLTAVVGDTRTPHVDFTGATGTTSQAWTVTSGTATITNESTTDPTISFTTVGTVVVQCIGHDDTGDTTPATITYTVRAGTAPGKPTTADTAKTLQTIGETFAVSDVFAAGDNPGKAGFTYAINSGSEYISLAGSTVTATKNTPSGTPAVVRVTNPYDSTYQDISVTVAVPVTISLAPSSVTITKGQTYNAANGLSMTPTGATATWSTNSSGVANVDASGVVTAVAPGTATITATAAWDSSKTASMSITVELPTIKVNKPNPEKIANVNGTATVTATLDSNNSPTVTVNSAVSWESSNTSIATVVGSGSNFASGNASAVITGKATGTATITCRSGVDGAVFGTTTVTVGNPTPVITLSFNPDVTGLGYGSHTYMNIHVDNPYVNDDGYSYVRITRGSRRVYVEEYNYSHPSTMVYWSRLDANGNTTVLVRPQYSGSVKLTVESSKATAQARTFTVSGYPTLPQTGQDFTLIYVLGACCLAAAAAWVIVYAKKKKNNIA